MNRLAFIFSIIAIAGACYAANSEVIDPVLIVKPSAIVSIPRVLEVNEPIEKPEVQPSAADKVFDHISSKFITEDGWSLTGYSSLSLDNNFNRQRWKFGFIGGEIAATENRNTERNWRTDHPEDFVDLEAKPVLGFHFMREF